MRVCLRQIRKSYHELQDEFKYAGKEVFVTEPITRASCEQTLLFHDQEMGRLMAKDLDSIEKLAQKQFDEQVVVIGEAEVKMPADDESKDAETLASSLFGESNGDEANETLVDLSGGWLLNQQEGVGTHIHAQSEPESLSQSDDQADEYAESADFDQTIGFG